MHHTQFCAHDVDRRFCGGGAWISRSDVSEGTEVGAGGLGHQKGVTPICSDFFRFVPISVSSGMPRFVLILLRFLPFFQITTLTLQPLLFEKKKQQGKPPKQQGFFSSRKP